jgi:hypothetical protein
MVSQSKNITIHPEKSRWCPKYDRNTKTRQGQSQISSHESEILILRQVSLNRDQHFLRLRQWAEPALWKRPLPNHYRRFERQLSDLKLVLKTEREVRVPHNLQQRMPNGILNARGEILKHVLRWSCWVNQPKIISSNIMSSLLSCYYDQVRYDSQKRCLPNNDDSP